MKKSEKGIDFDALRTILSGEIVDDERERYRLDWPGKKASLVKANTPITDTLRPDRAESVDWEHTENVFIEGDNFKALKILQESYLGQVKMIYIDPPYNTGKDFVYSDKFTMDKDEYEEAIGQHDEEDNKLFKENTKTNPRYHSDWLSMMYERLVIARDLLRDDGVIFISIDDNEVHNLRKVCDEIFGEENFVAQFVWERAFSPKNDAKFVSNSHDYVLLYGKSIEYFKIGRLPRTEEANARYSNPDNDPRGIWSSSDISVKTYNPENDYPIKTPSGRIVEPPAGRCWRLSEKTFSERLQDNRIWFGPDGNNTPRIKRFLSELKFDGLVPTSLLFYKEVGHSQEGSKEVVALFEGNGHFDGPKPVRLLKRLITISNAQDGDIILDFFAGSATTAHAVMAQNAEDGGNRRYIMVQLDEKTDEKSEAYKFGYKTIAQLSRERIRRAGQKILKEKAMELAPREIPLDIGFKAFKVSDSSFRKWQYNTTDPEVLAEQLKMSLDTLEKNAEDENVFYELLIKAGYTPTDKIKKIKDGYYLVNDTELAVVIRKDSLGENIQDILERGVEKVIFVERVFGNSDEVKVNTTLQLKQAGIEVKVV